MILAHHGIEVTESTLEAKVKKDFGGIQIENLAKLAESYGFTVGIAELDLDAMSILIGQGIFPIVYLNRVYFVTKAAIHRRYALANAIIHAVVPTHISPTFVTFNDPLPPGKRRRASRRRFEIARLDMNRWCVVCQPRKAQ